MAWETTSYTTTELRGLIEYQQDKRQHLSWAETRDRVRVNGKVVHQGWSSDHQGFDRYLKEVCGQ